MKQIQGVNKVGQVYVSRREAAKNTTGGVSNNLHTGDKTFAEGARRRCILKERSRRTRQNVFAIEAITKINKIGQAYVARREAAKSTTGG